MITCKKKGKARLQTFAKKKAQLPTSSESQKKVDFTSLHQMKSNLGSATVAEVFFPSIGSLVTLLLCFYLRISKYKIGKKKTFQIKSCRHTEK